MFCGKKVFSKRRAVSRRAVIGERAASLWADAVGLPDSEYARLPCGGCQMEPRGVHDGRKMVSNKTQSIVSFLPKATRILV